MMQTESWRHAIQSDQPKPLTAVHICTAALYTLTGEQSMPEKRTLHCMPFATTLPRHSATRLVERKLHLMHHLNHTPPKPPTKHLSIPNTLINTLPCTPQASSQAHHMLLPSISHAPPSHPCKHPSMHLDKHPLIYQPKDLLKHPSIYFLEHPLSLLPSIPRTLQSRQINYLIYPASLWKTPQLLQVACGLSM